MYLCTYVSVGPYWHLTVLGTEQVMRFIKSKCCHSECPFILKAVRDTISSYLRPVQDILEFCNWKRHKIHSISVLHYVVTAALSLWPTPRGAEPGFIPLCRIFPMLWQHSNSQFLCIAECCTAVCCSPR